MSNTTTARPSLVTTAAVLAALPATLELSLEDRAALASSAKAKNADILPGTHKVSFTVQIEGFVKKGADCETSVPGKIDMGLFAKYLLSKVNDTHREAFVEDFVNALESGEDLETALSQEKMAVERAMDRIAKSVRLATKATRSGATTFNGTCVRIA